MNRRERSPSPRYSLSAAAALARRLVDRAAWYSSGALGRARIGLRRALAQAGAEVQKEFLVLGCARGEDASGLFSELGAVLGCLQHYEAQPDLYTGVRVDFKDDGLYYDPAAGANWWEYYFEPVSIGRWSHATVRTVPSWQHDDFAEMVEQEMTRTAAAALLQRHVRIKPSVREQVDRYWRDHAGAAHVIGIHYRGTDKWEGSPVIPYESVAAAVREALPAAATPWKIFLATDEQACLDYVLGAFPGQVLHRPMRRSVDGRPIHKASGDGFRKGEDAVIDCLLLARCAQLIRTDSDLGLVATFFNPALPVRLLGPS